MSKSRYSKTKAAGLLVGMSRHKKELKSKTGGVNLAADNRQMRRLKARTADE